MTKIWYVFKKDLKSYLLSPLAYVLISVYLLLGGYFFSVFLLGIRVPSMVGYFGNMGVVLMFIAPVLTMRLLAEEEQKGTAELLLTSPLTISQIVLGKFFASFAVFLIMLGLSGIYVLILGIAGNPDWGPIISGYLGYLLLGGSYIAVGVFSSSLSNSQMVTGILGFGILLMFWIAGWAGSAVGGTVGQVLASISVMTRFNDFLKGLIDTSNVAYYLSVIFVFLFITVQSVARRAV